MSLDICKHPRCDHHNHNNRHIQHHSEFPSAPPPFVTRILNKSFTLLANFEVYNAVLLTLCSMLYNRPLECIHLS